LLLSVLAAAILVWPPWSVAQTAGAWQGIRTVTKEQIARAMRAQKSQGYDLTATSNGVRLQVGVILDLVREAAQSDPERHPLRVNHEDYYDAFLEVLELSPDEAPAFIRKAHEAREDQLIEYRKERVLARVRSGGEPRAAMTVLAGWPERPGARPHYTFTDTTSQPNVRVTHDQVNSYRILDFGDMIVYDDIRGIRGRATSGVLGFLFSIIGDGRAVQTRLAISADAIQVARTTAQKVLTITQTVTVHPDGQVEPDVPSDRPDLRRIAERLEQPLEVDYLPAPSDFVPARD
jgi:hypothetical protein